MDSEISNKYGIFVFTKNRPDVLNETLNFIKEIQIKKYIIDDSSDLSAQEAVKKICDSLGMRYLGKIEFQNFLQRINIDLEDYKLILAEPGAKDWNLGYARNFALLFARSKHIESVLFMDDDISVRDQGLVESILQEVQKHSFVGAKIIGMEDNSVLGHIATSLNIQESRTLSGGFMAFDLKSVHNFFINIYNEDWIWLYMHNRERNYPFHGSVHQNITNPYNGVEAKIAFQELGELIIDSILSVTDEEFRTASLTIEFWEKCIADRNTFIESLMGMLADEKLAHQREMLRLAKLELQKISPKSLVELFKEYRTGLSRFRTLSKLIHNL